MSWTGQTPLADKARAWCGGCRDPRDPDVGLVFWASDVTNNDRLTPLDWRPVPWGPWIVTAASPTAERFTRRVRPDETWTGARFAHHHDTCTAPKRGQRRKARARKTGNATPNDDVQEML